MRKHTTLAGTVALGVTAALALGGCASGSTTAGSEQAGAEEEVISVNFGYIPDFNGTSLLAIADDQGYWEDHGLEVETPSFTNGPLQIQALGTGDLDFGYIGPGAFWLPASGEAKIIAMNTLGQSDRVVAQPGIDSIEELAGKTVAVPEGTSGDMILTLALAEAGMTKDDVELVPMEPSAIVAALSSGQVDAAGLWYPALATVKEQVPDLVELAENSDFEDTVAFPTAFVAGNDVLENEPEKVERVLQALRDAMVFRYENPEEAIALTAAYNALAEEDVAADASNNKVLSLEELDSLTLDGTVDSWLNGMVDYFVESGKLSEPVEPAEFYTGEMFVEAGE
ncbi:MULTISPECIES: aliphatic sulfonate ABC transporter substrate-binding protein [Microbacterium]|jgi:NitT/TauT family transport system substrate-binding protein|uniref:aliphatic sulfonate ABC transporter substrate-binding protein n=1 Tax=Microbacterium TaxID=33882 RepID=UPI0008D90AFC|nr:MULTISPECIES: aliphatic sulfonate ABC transporter substrate-binding protein [Microbacterium]MAY50550.1 aliphatic sulfonates ABC transporter substrate-binding protein [Microbacterium sp.]HAS31860.1 aliphatic sulfonate ABC transporter substrate-binding protein [Microbacterium sp.]HBS75244.1 aliphatic sulfonate ABC transporter substrate-binding protein [Microbacterium sp.]|tara:strand:+ start:19443 stop:20462 length:1020 start_codon:yes stop_codon:yes gene_type:complete